MGAACATLLVALLADPTRHAVFAKPGGVNWPPKQFKFAVLASGYLPRDVRVQEWFRGRLEVPSLHVLGTGDAIICTDESLKLAATYSNTRIVRHPGGHFIPTTPTWRIFFNDYFEAWMAKEQEECSPPAPVLKAVVPRSQRIVVQRRWSFARGKR